MRARNVGEICVVQVDNLQGDNDEQRRWEEACRREEAIRDLLSRNPEGLKGRDVMDLAWELGAQPRPDRKNIAEVQGRTIGAFHAHFEAIAAGILAPNQPEILSLIYAANLRLRLP